jgi:hypothetical protein
MCYIELEPCGVWLETERKARKAHQCSSCKGAILPGQPYTKHFSILEPGDRPVSEKICAPCVVARSEFGDAHESGDPTPSYFPAMLVECIQEGDAESEAKWKPMLEAIQGRGRGQS